jgi:hypothetical protein
MERVFHSLAELQPQPRMLFRLTRLTGQDQLLRSRLLKA